MMDDVNIISYSLGRKQNTFLNFISPTTKEIPPRLTSNGVQIQDGSNFYELSTNSVTTVKHRKEWDINHTVSGKAHVATTPLSVLILVEKTMIFKNTMKFLFKPFVSLLHDLSLLRKASTLALVTSHLSRQLQS